MVKSFKIFLYFLLVSVGWVNLTVEKGSEGSRPTDSIGRGKPLLVRSHCCRNLHVLLSCDICREVYAKKQAKSVGKDNLKFPYSSSSQKR